mmetsp:Transcript_28435/g.67683  ORF Transcript_28435/g.67683 Transcript_28435/m.67683 type:complete len:341 (-) Transcript_28435:150-1172(-)
MPPSAIGSGSVADVPSSDDSSVVSTIVPRSASSELRSPDPTFDSKRSCSAPKSFVLSDGTMITCTTRGMSASPEFSAPVTSSSEASKPNNAASDSISVSCFVKLNPSTSPALSPIVVTTPQTTSGGPSSLASNGRSYSSSGFSPSSSIFFATSVKSSPDPPWGGYPRTSTRILSPSMVGSTIRTNSRSAGSSPSKSPSATFSKSCFAASKVSTLSPSIVNPTDTCGTSSGRPPSAIGSGRFPVPSSTTPTDVSTPGIPEVASSDPRFPLVIPVITASFSAVRFAPACVGVSTTCTTSGESGFPEFSRPDTCSSDGSNPTRRASASISCSCFPKSNSSALN